ncbi:hypothetical protein BpHYR1_036903, partial [Brachionus plicatilis]
FHSTHSTPSMSALQSSSGTPVRRSTRLLQNQTSMNNSITVGSKQSLDHIPFDRRGCADLLDHHIASNCSPFSSTKLAIYFVYLIGKFYTNQAQQSTHTPSSINGYYFLRSSSYGQPILNNITNSDSINSNYPASTGNYSIVNSSNHYSSQVSPTYYTSSRLTNNNTNSGAPHYTTYSSVVAANSTYKPSATQSSQYDRVLSSINQNLNNIYSSAVFASRKYDSGYPVHASQVSITPNYRSKSSYSRY